MQPLRPPSAGKRLETQAQHARNQRQALRHCCLTPISTPTPPYGEMVTQHFNHQGPCAAPVQSLEPLLGEPKPLLVTRSRLCTPQHPHFRHSGFPSSPPFPEPWCFLSPGGRHVSLPRCSQQVTSPLNTSASSPVKWDSNGAAPPPRLPPCKGPCADRPDRASYMG